MIPTEWLGHRRASDGELVGYLVPGPGGTWTRPSVDLRDGVEYGTRFTLEVPVTGALRPA